MKENGEPYVWSDTYWWLAYCAPINKDNGREDPDSPIGRLFRRRFRVPYHFFVNLVAKVKDLGWFPCVAKNAEVYIYLIHSTVSAYILLFLLRLHMTE
jgi:hypothetical protein